MMTTPVSGENDSNWKTDFMEFCADICSGEKEKEETGLLAEDDEGVICLYCGKRTEGQGVTKSNMKEPICEECRRRMVADINQCQKLVNEVQKNVSELFGIRLETVFIVEKENKLWKEIGRIFLGKVNEEEPAEVVIKDTKNGYYQILIEKKLPDAVIAANVIVFLCNKFLGDKYGNEDVNFLTGLAQWFSVHYLYILDLEDYAVMYDKKAENDIKLKEGYTLWKEVLKSPLCRQVIRLGKIDENLDTVKERLSQKSEEPGLEEIEESREEL